MIVSQTDIDHILGKTRRRVLYVPVKSGTLGELKRCPFRAGGVYELEPRIPYAQHLEQAERAPSRARAVLELLALCEMPRRTMTITVSGRPTRVVQVGAEAWRVPFELGDRSHTQDDPRYLVRHNGSPLGQYTSRKDKAMRGEPEAIPEGLQIAYSKEAEANDQARHLQPVHGPAARIEAEIVELRAQMRAEGVSDAQMRRELQRLERTVGRIRARFAQAA